MFEELNKHRQAVRENIEKSLTIGFTGGQDLDEGIEKAHQVGDVHPNGKWVWTQLPSGKFDWRVIKKKDGQGTGAPAAQSTATQKPASKTAPAVTSQKQKNSEEIEKQTVEMNGYGLTNSYKLNKYYNKKTDETWYEGKVYGHDLRIREKKTEEPVQLVNGTSHVLYLPELDGKPLVYEHKEQHSFKYLSKCLGAAESNIEEPIVLKEKAEEIAHSVINFVNNPNKIENRKFIKWYRELANVADETHIKTLRNTLADLGIKSEHAEHLVAVFEKNKRAALIKVSPEYISEKFVDPFVKKRMQQTRQIKRASQILKDYYFDLNLSLFWNAHDETEFIDMEYNQDVIKQCVEEAIAKWKPTQDKGAALQAKKQNLSAVRDNYSSQFQSDKEVDDFFDKLDDAFEGKKVKFPKNAVSLFEDIMDKWYDVNEHDDDMSKWEDAVYKLLTK